MAINCVNMLVMVVNPPTYILINLVFLRIVPLIVDIVSILFSHWNVFCCLFYRIMKSSWRVFSFISSYILKWKTLRVTLSYLTKKIHNNLIQMSSSTCTERPFRFGITFLKVLPVSHVHFMTFCLYFLIIYNNI